MAEHSLELDEDGGDDDHSAGGRSDDHHDAADHGSQGDDGKMAMTVKIVMVTMKMAADKKVPPVAGSVVART